MCAKTAGGVNVGEYEESRIRNYVQVFKLRSCYVHVCKQVFKNGSGDDQVADADDRSGLDFVVNVVLFITRMRNKISYASKISRH